MVYVTRTSPAVFFTILNEPRSTLRFTFFLLSKYQKFARVM